MIINTIILSKFGWTEHRFWNKPFLITDLKKNDMIFEIDYD